MLSPEFLLTSLIVVLIPGTGTIYTVSTGLFYGPRASVAAAFGCTLGILPHLLASILGLSFILHMSAVVFQGLKFAGAIYLLYLAWAMWREHGAFTFGSASDAASSKSFRQIVVRAVLLNLLNPKLTLFFFAFLPLSISADASSPLATLVLLSLIFMLITFVVFVVYGVLAGGVRKHVVGSPRVILWLRRSFAAAFAGLGVRLAVTDR